MNITSILDYHYELVISFSRDRLNAVLVALVHLVPTRYQKLIFPGRLILKNFINIS